MSQSQSNGAPNANLLRERLILEQVELVQDEAGGSASQWIAVEKMWASIRLTGALKTQISGERFMGRTIWRIIVRYRPSIQRGMRFRSAGGGFPAPRIFSILTVSDEDGRRRFLKCICEEQN